MLLGKRPSHQPDHSRHHWELQSVQSLFFERREKSESEKSWNSHEGLQIGQFWWYLSLHYRGTPMLSQVQSTTGAGHPLNICTEGQCSCLLPSHLCLFSSFWDDCVFPPTHIFPHGFFPCLHLPPSCLVCFPTPFFQFLSTVLTLFFPFPLVLVKKEVWVECNEVTLFVRTTCSSSAIF